MASFDLYDFADFRSYLKAVFQARLDRNPRYSYRAFSRDLGLSPQALNNVFNERYGFSHETAVKVTLKLSLYDREADYFIALVDAEHARNPHQRKRAKERMQELKTNRSQSRRMNPAQMSLFSEWYIPAVLELVTNLESSFDRMTVAMRLGISLTELETSLHVLLKNKFLEIKSGRYVRPKQKVATETTGLPSVVTRFHRQILKKAHDAIENEDQQLRKSVSAVFSFEPDRFDEAKNDIAKFQAAFLKKYSTDKKTNSIYAVLIDMFQLSQEL